MRRPVTGSMEGCGSSDATGIGRETGWFPGLALQRPNKCPQIWPPNKCSNPLTLDFQGWMVIERLLGIAGCISFGGGEGPLKFCIEKDR